jgi:ketosteroid isomerase-like protein
VSPPTDDAVHRWLDRFAELVRARDTATAETMFHADCTAFGTRTAHMTSRHQLVEEQWLPIWHTTEGFHFLATGRGVAAADDGSVIVATALWSSDGIDEDGGRYPRHGRATIVFESATESEGTPHLVARHTHFSVVP